MIASASWRCISLCLASAAFAAAQEYVIDTIAGGAVPPEQVAAVNVGIGAPQGVAVDVADNLYFTSLNCVFKVDALGLLTRFAGNARPGYSGDGSPARSAQLNNPRAIAFDSAGNLYIVDTGNNRIRKVTPDGVITTIAGTAAQLNDPTGIAVDRGANLYIADNGNNRIRKITPDGSITSVAGTGVAGYSGDGGPANAAQLAYPFAVTVDSAGVLYISDSGNRRIRKVGPNGNIATVEGTTGFEPIGLAADALGNLYSSDDLATIRKVASDGSVTTIAGGAMRGYSGDGGPAVRALLNNPSYLAANAQGDLYFTDNGNGRVRKISRSGIIRTIAGDGSSVPFLGDGGLATNALLTRPAGVAVDSAGDVYIADTGNGRIRQVLPDGIIITVAGGGSSTNPDGVPATSGQLHNPTGVAVGPTGDLYIADFNETTQALRVSSDRVFARVPLSLPGVPTVGIAVDKNGVIYVLGDNLQASEILEIPLTGNARLVVGDFPTAMALDFDGRLYFSDRTGVIYTSSRQAIAGHFPPLASFGGDGGPAINASFYAISGLAFDYLGNLYISDAGNGRIRKVTPDGIVNTIAGTGAAGYSGDGGPATSAQLNFPGGLAVDLSGNIYVADTGNNAVRVLRPVSSPNQSPSLQ